MVEDNLPLAGIRIADFSKLLPGPWCTQLLADMGAQVIKIERPEGDPSRHSPPLYRTESVYFCSVNGGKQSVALDLATGEGRAQAHRLIADADVLVESFGKGGAEKLGIGWQSARAVNARLIYCSITGFGQTGELSLIAGHDLAIQAATGLLSLADAPAPAFQAADAAATTAAIAILRALRTRDCDGQGRYIDVAMFDALFGMGNIGLADALGRLAGGTGTPRMEVWGGNPRYRTYATRDGKKVAVCLLEGKIWRRFCEHIGRQDLIFEDEDPKARLSNHGDRADLFEQVLGAYYLARDRDVIGAEAMALSIPIMPVLTPDEAVSAPHVRSRRLVEEVEHPTEGRVFTLRGGLVDSGLVRRRRKAAPALP